MKTHTHAAHNLVAVFADDEHAGQAIEALHEAGIPVERLSVLGRSPDNQTPEEGAEVTNKWLIGGAKGTAAGAVAGMAAGALLLAVPGVGPLLGAGVLAGALGGAAAGGTAGALWGGFSQMWDMNYRDLVQEGRVLVAVHTDDEDEAARATKLLCDAGTERLDHLDSRGELRQQS